MPAEIESDQDARDRIDGVTLATTDTTRLRYELHAGDDPTLDPVQDGGDPVAMTYHELAIRYHVGEFYIPDDRDVRFGPAVDHLAGYADTAHPVVDRGVASD